MSSYIIAVDFDGTICENKYPAIGEPRRSTISYLKEKQKKGAKLILWTCRVDELLDSAVKWCRNQGLIFDAVNENLPEVVAAFGGDTRKIFANEYIDDRNGKLPDESKSSLLSWAEQEVKFACEHERGDKPKEEWDYGCACYESALKAFKSLEEDNHSGFSIGFTKGILNRLIDGKPLCPIEDTEETWSHIADTSGHQGEEVNYQCKRMSSLFKYVYADGTVKYRDIDRFIMVETLTNTIWHSGLVDQVLEEQVNTAESDIKVQEKRRVDLIYNLADCVKQYDKHEAETLAAIVEGRGSAGDIENATTAIAAVSEAYPELKADENYRELMNELAMTENLIAEYRSNYNKQVKAYNRYVKKFPTRIFLNMLGYERQSYQYLDYEAPVDAPQNLFGED